MRSTTTTMPVTTGFSNFDTLFEADGIPTGSICTIRSDPRASAYEFLLSIMGANSNSAHFVTTERRKQHIMAALSRLDYDLKTGGQIIDLSNGTTCSEMIDALDDQAIEPRDLIVIDSLNAVTDTETQAYSDLYRTLKTIAIDTDSVVLCHYHTQAHKEIQFASTIEYLTDLQLSLSMSLSQEGIKQQLWIERLPVGEGLKESQRDTRLVTVHDSGDQLSLNTGGRI